jgi:hypothetical protein
MPAYSRNIEGLAEAIIKYSGYLEPSSELHAARNPGGLRATSMRHAKNEQGHRIFNSFIDGVQALLFDLQTKLSGKSWAELSPESTLKDLAVAYSLPDTTGSAWARFLRAALHDQSISAETPLSYFTDKGQN